MIKANDSKLRRKEKKPYVLHLFLCVYLRQESDQISREKEYWNLR